MTTALATSTTAIQISDKARAYQRKSRAASTVKIYRAALRDFDDFCHARGWSSAPAEPYQVIEYLVFIADGQAVSTIKVKLAAIAYAHRVAHLPDPTVDADVKETLAGIVRTKGTRPVTKSPATLDLIRQMVKSLPDNLHGVRDRAIMLIGFGGMFRRAEIVGLTVSDVTLSGTHLTLLVRRGKTDQQAKGLVKHFEMLSDADLCPVRALKAWLDKSGIRRGPLFRSVDRWGNVGDGELSEEAIATIVKSAAAGIGLDSSQFSGHSLRRGGVTSAFLSNADERDVMNQSGHTDPKTVRHYNDDSGRGATKAMRAAFGEKDS